MRIKIMSLLLAILLCSLSSNKTIAQETYLKNRWNIKLSAAPYAKGYKPDGGSITLDEDGKVLYGKLKPEYTTDIRLEGNYGILNFLEIGAYMGYARYGASIMQDLTRYFGDGHFLSYGVQVNLHIFPFFIKKPDFRFDLYVTAKYGGRSSLVSKNYKYEHEWAAGLGFAFYFSKHVGIFAEYSFGKFLIKDSFHNYSNKTLPFFPSKSTVRAGFSVKFKPEKKQK